MPGPKPKYSREQIVSAVRDYGSQKAAAKALGISESVVSHAVKGANLPKQSPEQPTEGVAFEGSLNTQVLTARSKTVRTLDEALKVGNVDTAIWEVERWVLNKWDCVAKANTADDVSTLTATELWQVKVWLRRKIAKPLADAFDLLMARMEKSAPKWPQLPRFKPPQDPHLLEIALDDAHFGQLSWLPEAGENYDLRIAEKVYLDAVTDLLGKASGYAVEKIVLPVGNDFFNIDNPENMTVNGTPQDCDGRLAKMIDVGVEAVQKAIALMAQVAPVEVLYVPGNHDRHTAYFLCRELRAHFHACPRVTVDITPSPQKAVHYGCNLVAMSHGDEEPHRDLPALMASMWPDAWAKSRFRHWHCGHWHKRKELYFLAGDTYGGGVEVRCLPSLAARSAWATRKGFRSSRAADAYLWNKARGFAGFFTTNVAA